jgi:hypothetical protein
MNHAEAAKRHRHQAEEFRAKADLMIDETARASYLKIAEAYDGMAATEERLVSSPLS